MDSTVVLSVLAAVPVFVSLCFKPSPESCLTPPVLVEAEVWCERAVEGAEVRWMVDGEAVASDRLRGLGPETQRVAMILDPVRLTHRVEVALFVHGSEARDRMVLPPVCPFLLQLDSFRWNSKGLTVRLSNEGPAPSGSVALRWTINGVLYSQQRLDPLPAGTTAELHLPASASSLLEAALTGPEPGEKGRSRLTPVVVSLEARPGPGDLEAPVKTWQFFLGYAGVRGSARR
ncbi:hypothetical protein [Thermoanaerobaculum aquaticum]|uniref:hypothetical protein n=1 Tax=Thermoanaerobaculum aquaticum TaxID=1312852 RepID=UPI0012696BF8|nr:hypothetical protein [Thermoanaerobaculum aquaticum]